MHQEEIARLTGTLKFNVEARPLVAFEKRLNGVMTLLREFSTIANKKFTVKVALDSRSLRAQIEKATKTKISLTNIDVSHEALSAQGKRIQEYLDKTPIRLSNVRIDIGKLVDQKKFVKTLMGQMHIDLPFKLGLTAMESELRREVKAIGARNPIRVAVEINQNHLIMKLRRAIIQAQKNIGALKIRVAEPQVRLKIDKQHLVAEIRAAIQNEQFDIRIGAKRTGGGNGGSPRGEGGGHGRSQMHRGLSAMEGFARGALPGLGAAMAFSKMNDINQKVTAADNSLEAVSGNAANYKSNKNFLTNMTHEMGLNFRDVAPQYSSIFQSAAPKIGVAKTQDMFRGIMQYGTVHGLDKEAMKGSMVALSQMFGKDKIQSEEARQQFSERMPNGMAMLAQAAFNAKATKSNSVADFGDLMKKGNADPSKILPELGRLMKEASEHNDAYKKSLETTRVAQGRMNTAFEDSVIIFAKGGFDKGLGGFFNKMADSMERATPLTKALGGAFELLIKPLNAVVTLIGDLGEAWPKIANYFGVSEKALAAFGAAVGIFMLPFGGFIVALGLAALALEDLVSYSKGGESVFGNLVKDIPGAQDQMDNLSQAFDHLQNSFSEIGLAFDGLKEKYKDVFDNVKTENPFVVMLRTVGEKLEMIAGFIDHISAFMRGDWRAGLANIPGPKEILIDKNPMFIPARYIAPKIGDALSGLGSGAADWLASHRRDGGMPVPSPLLASGPASSAATNVTIPSITLTVQAPAGVADPKAFAQELAPHVETLITGAWHNALGAARAQQAERQ